MLMDHPHRFLSGPITAELIVIDRIAIGRFDTVPASSVSVPVRSFGFMRRTSSVLPECFSALFSRRSQAVKLMIG